tara:strand:+ start:2525 stop:3196 length:672 start_codon:yes stop_codon:yes gene_type:complete
MHDSAGELARFELRSKVSSSLLFLGILSITFSVILGLVVKDPLTLGMHLYLFVVGVLLVFCSLIVHKDEMSFASQFDMSHLLDIDSKELRHQAYLQHLSEWIAPGIEEINPVRARGEDPTGPDWGKTDFKLGHEPARRDAITENEKYAGMEGELTSGERMVAKANDEYSELAQKRWELAESSDPDLVEYGVERLGDLVNTDYFEKNAEDGAFSKVVNQDDESR